MSAAPLPDYEKLGVFYLGKKYDLRAKQTSDDLVLFPSKNLVTHGLVVGMTGSGKTGLCLDIIEEAAIDNIPCIVVDPKGDLGNLLLTFPDLKTGDFQPWIHEEDAQKVGMTVEAFAAAEAEKWKQGLAQWGQDGERIKRLRDAADFAIYTPGSSSGCPVSVMRSFACPPVEVREDGEAFRDQVYSAVAGLLQLVGVEADPVQSRDTVLLMNLLQNAWAAGRDLDLAGLIAEVQQPSVSKIGVLDVDTFFPAKERFELAMRLNNLLASPSFQSWMQGEPLDIKRMLYTPAGKPRVAIFSVAHLGDAERMFFVTMLLNQTVSWMRAQSGTSSLRAMFYMDEIFGYFPPVANPPSKLPLLTLLKQGRAFGLGVVLATQNPVDLDYKGLANIGTWFIGRLQTERDKARVLDGLEGAAGDQGGKFNRKAMEQILASLGPRIFLLHSVHENAQALFESRWAMSYLRGPLSRVQIKQLMAAKKQAEPPPPPAKSPTMAGGAETSRNRPMLPPDVPQVFGPARKSPGDGDRLIYRARVLAAASVRYTNAKAKVDYPHDLLVAVDLQDGPVPVDWSSGEELAFAVDEFENVGPEGGEYTACIAAASQPKNYAKWNKDFVAWVYGQRRLNILYSPYFKLYAEAEESEGDFKIRLQQAGREERDAEVEKLRRKFEPKHKTAAEKLRKAQAVVQKQAEQAQQSKLGTIASIGSTVLGAIFGKRTFSAGNIGKATGAVKSIGRASQEASDVTRAEETVAAIQQEVDTLSTTFNAECEKLTTELDQAMTQIESIEVKPTKTNIAVKLVALAWMPYVAAANGAVEPAF